MDRSYMSQSRKSHGIFLQKNIVLECLSLWKLYFTHYSCVVIVCSIRLYVVCIFYGFFYKTSFFVFLCFLWIKTLKYASSCYLILICNFVLVLYKNSTLNNKLFIKVLQYYVKTCFQRCFVFSKNKTKKPHL